MICIFIQTAPQDVLVILFGEPKFGDFYLFVVLFTLLFGCLRFLFDEPGDFVFDSLDAVLGGCLGEGFFEQKDDFVIAVHGVLKVAFGNIELSLG